MPHRVVFGRQPGKVVIESFSLPVVSTGHVRVRTTWSLMSIGTESIMLHHRFEPGTHWAKWMTYPFACPGYSAVGIVEEIGDSVTGFVVGDRVTCRHGHASHMVVPIDRCCRIPDHVPDQEATWFALGKVAWHGVRAANVRLGDHCLILGAGPVGQMVARWAAIAGCGAVVMVDTSSMRLALAKSGGATHTVAKPVDQAEADIIAACGGSRPDIVIDSTGNAAVFVQALALVADRGRMVLLGDTGTPSQQHLSFDVILRGITIVGAHDCHEDARWNLPSISALFLDMVNRNRLSLAGLNTHSVPAREIPEAYALVERERASVMGMLFDWTSASP